MIQTKNNFLTRIILLNVFILIGNVYPQDGQLDKTFGQNGIVKTEINFKAQNSKSRSVAFQSDGKIVAAGYSSNKTNVFFSVVRYNVDGTLDNTFGKFGNVTSKIGNFNSEAYAVGIQKNGSVEKIIAAGYSHGKFDNDFTILRLNPDGSFDHSFGPDNNGVVVTPIGSKEDIAHSLVIQNDGKIVVAGNSFNGTDDDFAIVRYDSNGTLDSGFGINGIIISDISGSHTNDVAYSLTIQPDGKIVAAGSTNNSGDFAIARFQPSGFNDNTFGTNGKVITPIGQSYDIALSVAIQSDNKIVVGGYSNNGTDNDFALVRYDDKGNLDGSFGNEGKVITPAEGHNEFWSIGIQPININTEKILAAGFISNGNNYDFALVRYNSDGKLDKTFGNSGTGLIIIPVSKEDNKAFAAAFQRIKNSGAVTRIVIAGYSDIKSIDHFAAACFLPDGKFDDTFGVNGIVKTPVGTSTGYMYGLAMQPTTDAGEKIIAAGFSDSSFVAIRYNLDGTIDSSFGINGSGVASTDPYDKWYIYSVAIQNDRKILLAGQLQNHIVLVRLTADGILDNEFGKFGIVNTIIGSKNDVAYSLTIQTDGKIIIAGTYNNDSVDNFF